MFFVVIEDLQFEISESSASGESGTWDYSPCNFTSSPSERGELLAISC
jgi:hypothetical protein